MTETKTIGQLDRNDMSYVPATTIKNGRTLSLANVEWQVTGTDLVGETLMPSSYQAVATYSAKASYNAATGYITTAEYVCEGIEETLQFKRFLNKGCRVLVGWNGVGLDGLLAAIKVLDHGTRWHFQSESIDGHSQSQQHTKYCFFHGLR